jgi:RNA polymerase sigma-B factor
MEMHATKHDRTEELELFRVLRSSDDPEQQERIKDELIRRYQGLVRWLARHYDNPAVDFEDLMQVGYLGLVQAIKRFDPDRGFDFISFARPTVQGELRRYFRDKRRWIRLPRKVQEVKLVVHRATESLTHELGRGPTVAELAARLAVDEELVLEALTADDVYSPQSLDALIADDEPDARSVGETIGSVDARMDVVVDRIAVRPLLESLSQRERRILYMRFFQDMTQAQIGAELGLSQMHISRLLTQILNGLRTRAAAEITAA